MSRRGSKTTGPPPAESHPFDVGWRERLAVLGGIGLALLVGFVLGNRFAPRVVVELMGIIPIAFVAAGKFLPLWGISPKSSLGPYQLGVVIWLLDTFTVVVFVYSFEAFYKIAPLHRWLNRMYANMRLVLKAYPRIKKASVAGVMLFVLFPVSGTGALAASVIGLLLGMHRAVLIASVSAGGFVGGMGMAFLTANFASAVTSLKAVQENPSSQYWIFAALVLSIGVALYFLNRAFRRALADAEEAG